MYDPDLVKPMREEVTRLGVQELMSAADVDAAVKKPGTMLLFVNSVCGCAAGGARPGLRLSLLHTKKPAQLCTVFAGMETAATERAREYFKPYRSIATPHSSSSFRRWWPGRSSGIKISARSSTARASTPRCFPGASRAS
jgi:putative YphP/YqiW family bacilliredoxin